MKNQKWKIIILSIIVMLTGLFIYVAYPERFFSEYWLQRKILETPYIIEPKVSFQDNYIEYEFEYTDIFSNEDIRINFRLDSTGLLELCQGCWRDGHSVFNYDNESGIIFQSFVDPSVYFNIRQEILNSWKESTLLEGDYKLGSEYYSLKVVSTGMDVIEITYLSAKIDNTFNDIRKQIIKISNDAINLKSK